MLTFIILGIIQGAIIGLVALGLVLVYKGARVFNFAQAEFGTLGAFFLYFFVEANGVPYALGAILALVSVGLVGLLMEQLVIRPLFDAPRVTLLVASAAVALLAIALLLLIGGTQQRALGPAIQGSGIQVAGLFLTPQRILTLLTLVGIAAGLAYFFNKTDLGLGVLAASQEPVATELVGIGTRRISTFVWVFAAVLGGVAGILQGPDTVITPGFMTQNYLLLGFTAAVLGGMTSLVGAFVGGQLIGLVLSLGTYFEQFTQDAIDIPALPRVLVFVMLISVLLVRPKGLFGAEA